MAIVRTKKVTMAASRDVVASGSRRVLVVDDEPIIAALLSSALNAGGFQTHTCASVAEARAAILDFDPDAAVLDVSLGRGPTGIDLAHILQEKHPGVAVLMLTKHGDLRSAGYTAADLPPNIGLLHKESIDDAGALILAVESLLAEQPPDATTEPSGPLTRLTSQQVAVLRMMAQGYTSAEIARKRGTSTSAVEKMLAAIYTALDLESNGTISPRIEAVRVFIASAGVPERP